MTKFDKRAANNINKIYPKLDNTEHKKLKRDMWDNLEEI